MNTKKLLIPCIVLISTLNLGCSVIMYNRAKIDDHKNGSYVRIKDMGGISVGDNLVIESNEGILCGVVVESGSPDSVSVKVTFSQVDTVSQNDVVKYDKKMKETFFLYKDDVMMRLSGFYIDGVFIVIFTAVYLAIASIGNL